MVLLFNYQRAAWLPLRSIKRQLETLLTCSGYADWDLGVHFVDNGRIQELNHQYRYKNKPTDILSFPFHSVQDVAPESAQSSILDPQSGLDMDDAKNLGELFLSIPYILKDCKEHNERLTDRLPILFTHGICHLLGYDHELDNDYKLMADKERRILETYKTLANDSKSGLLF